MDTELPDLLDLKHHTIEQHVMWSILDFLQSLLLLWTLLKTSSIDWALWLMPVIPEIWEAVVDRSLELTSSKTSLGNMVKPHLYKKYKNSPGVVAYSYSPNYLGGWGGSILEPRRLRLQKTMITAPYFHQDKTAKLCLDIRYLDFIF